DVPTVAADGRVVPVMIESDLPMAAERYVKAVHLLVDNNPDIHLAEFRLTPQIGQAFVSTRLRMRMTSPIRAIVETSDGALSGSGSSRDPFVEFSLRADREAALKFVWKDNKGGVFQQSVDIKFIT